MSHCVSRADRFRRELHICSLCKVWSGSERKEVDAEVGVHEVESKFKMKLRLGVAEMKVTIALDEMYAEFVIRSRK